MFQPKVSLCTLLQASCLIRPPSLSHAFSCRAETYCHVSLSFSFFKICNGFHLVALSLSPDQKSSHSSAALSQRSFDSSLARWPNLLLENLHMMGWRGRGLRTAANSQRWNSTVVWNICLPLHKSWNWVRELKSIKFLRYSSVNVGIFRINNVKFVFQ